MLKHHLTQTLEFTRGLTDQLLAEFDTQDSWTARPHEHANHALWFVGHMGVADNFALSLVTPDRKLDRDDFHALFGAGSEPRQFRDAYPPLADVQGWMTERRATVLDALAGLHDDDLNAETPESAPPFLPNAASVFQFLIWHESLHFGQITVVHRALGHAPLVGRAPAEASA